MPCRSDYLEPNENERGEAAEVRRQLEEIGNRATAGADVLREYLLGNASAMKILTLVNQPLKAEFDALLKINLSNYVKVSDSFLQQVEDLVEEYVAVNEIVTHTGKDSLDDETKAWVMDKQLNHRKHDLGRLMVTFAENGDTVRLRKVIDADPMLPLAAQLGFDPDEF